ncbi:MAG: hypothetical protein R2729_01450 [Bryobacteraceae bacterium]
MAPYMQLRAAPKLSLKLALEMLVVESAVLMHLSVKRIYEGELVVLTVVVSKELLDGIELVLTQ